MRNAAAAATDGRQPQPTRVRVPSGSSCCVRLSSIRDTSTARPLRRGNKLTRYFLVCLFSSRESAPRRASQVIL
eukprot:5348494-Prymnesium_polylepis.2